MPRRGSLSNELSVTIKQKQSASHEQIDETVFRWCNIRIWIIIRVAFHARSPHQCLAPSHRRRATFRLIKSRESSWERATCPGLTMINVSLLFFSLPFGPLARQQQSYLCEFIISHSTLQHRFPFFSIIIISAGWSIVKGKERVWAN